MQREAIAESPSERLEVAYTDKPVSGWGGLVALVRFFDRQGLRPLLVQALPDGRTSPNQIPVVDIVLALFTAVLTGGRRFAHVERLRADRVVQTLLGIPRMPSAMTLTRYFGGFVRSQVEQLSEVLWSLMARGLRAPSLGMVLDLDSTVFERYGQQEGSLKGHNPRKHGRPSHHPLLAMLAEAKVVVHAWLRSGNTGTARGVRAFLAETLARLGEGLRLYALRADAGFFEREFLEELESRGLPYAIAVRMTRPLKREIVGLRTWMSFGAGLEAAELAYQAAGWRAPRRIVVVREELRERPDAKGRRLIEVPGYTFHGVVTTLALDPVATWRFYNSRADCENRLKELKDDFGADGFCLQSFDGTEAVFRLICFLFNLVAVFKRDVTRNESPRLATLRTDLLVVGAIVGADGRKTVLRLGLRGERRERFAQLLQRLAALVPTVAPGVFPKVLTSPRPWRPRLRPARRGWLPSQLLPVN
jgi:hypothetical protein